MGPGSNNPFGFDLSELIRMLQSPGPVNMEIARRTAHESATHDPETGEDKPEPAMAPAAVAAFDDVVRAAQLSVAEATGISAARTVSARAVDRKVGADATLNGLEPVLASLASALGRGQVAPEGDDPSAVSPEAFLAMLMQQLVPLLLGAWSGSMIGALSHHALGQYDLPLPLTGDPAMLFVVHNVEAFGSEWSLPQDELRYALALREVVHSAQRAIPWVRDRLVRVWCMDRRARE